MALLKLPFPIDWCITVTTMYILPCDTVVVVGVSFPSTNYISVVSCIMWHVQGERIRQENIKEAERRKELKKKEEQEKEKRQVSDGCDLCCDLHQMSCAFDRVMCLIVTRVILVSIWWSDFDDFLGVDSVCIITEKIVNFWEWSRLQFTFQICCCHKDFLWTRGDLAQSMITL